MIINDLNPRYTIFLPMAFGLALSLSSCGSKPREAAQAPVITAELTLPEDMTMSAQDSVILSNEQTRINVNDTKKWNTVFETYNDKQGVIVEDLTKRVSDPGDIEGINENDRIGTITSIKQMTITDPQLRKEVWGTLCTDSLDVRSKGVRTLRIDTNNGSNATSTSLLLRNNTDTTFVTLMECRPLVEHVTTYIDGKKHPELTTREQVEAYLKKQGIKNFSSSSSKYVETTNGERVLKVRLNYTTK